MAKKPGLGRGLAALLGESSDAADARAAEAANSGGSAAEGADAAGTVPHAGTAGAPGIIDIPVGLVRRNPRQPRRAMESAALEELASSIASVGIVQPVIVRETDQGYELIAGERRWRAAQLAGFTVVPAIVRKASDVESLELALIENVVRQQLNPVDEAYALKVLLEDLGVTQENLAARVGKSRSAITNKMRLLDLPGPVQELLADGSLSEGHGRALLGLPERGRQLQLARRVVDKGLSVRQVEDEVRNAVAGAGKPKARQGIAASFDQDTLDEIRDAVYGRFGITPRVRSRGDGGVIEVPFKDPGELAGIIERLRADS
jgi:ParB family transcriptional regulator, chromosome partitioning protein